MRIKAKIWSLCGGKSLKREKSICTMEQEDEVNKTPHPSFDHTMSSQLLNTIAMGCPDPLASTHYSFAEVYAQPYDIHTQPRLSPIQTDRIDQWIQGCNIYNQGGSQSIQTDRFDQCIQGYSIHTPGRSPSIQTGRIDQWLQGCRHGSWAPPPSLVEETPPSLIEEILPSLIEETYDEILDIITSDLLSESDPSLLPYGIERYRGLDFIYEVCHWLSS